MKKFLLPVFMVLVVLFSFNCHKEVAKDNTDKVLAEPNRIPPGHAEIKGEIVEIEPVSKTENYSPCSKAPCMAKVKIDGVAYGAGFPVLSKNKEIMIKFNFTLAPTTKELFPNMDDSYPGLKVGDKFSALAGFNVPIGSDKPEFFVYGYTKN